MGAAQLVVFVTMVFLGFYNKCVVCHWFYSTILISLWIIAVIHQQALAAKVVDFSRVMTLVVKLLNSIWGKVLIQGVTGWVDAAHKDLLLCADVQWLSCSKMLQQFVDLLPDIKTFPLTGNEEREELSDDSWLLDRGFLTGLRLTHSTMSRTGKTTVCPAWWVQWTRSRSFVVFGPHI